MRLGAHCKWSRFQIFAETGVLPGYLIEHIPQSDRHLLPLNSWAPDVFAVRTAITLHRANIQPTHGHIQGPINAAYTP